MSVAITEAIVTLAEAEARFHLSRTEAEAFFLEWCTDLPTLTEAEKTGLAEMRRRYLYQRAQGQLLENTVTLLFASPLLTLAGFYDPPFRLKAEESVQITLTDSEEVLQGRLDALVLKDHFWVMVLEAQGSKKTALSVWSALPQTLAYLMAFPEVALTVWVNCFVSALVASISPLYRLHSAATAWVYRVTTFHSVAAPLVLRRDPLVQGRNSLVRSRHSLVRRRHSLVWRLHPLVQGRNSLDRPISTLLQ